MKKNFFLNSIKTVFSIALLHFSICLNQTNDNPLFKSTHPVLARPILTLPSFNNTPYSSGFSISPFFSTTLPFKDQNKKFVENSFNLEIIPIVKDEFALVTPELGDLVGELFEIITHGTVEKHSLGVLLNYSHAINSSHHEEDNKSNYILNIKTPITLSAAHFYLTKAEIERLKAAADKVTKMKQNNAPPQDDETLFYFGNLKDLETFLKDIKVEPINLKINLITPSYKHKNLSFRGKLGVNIDTEEFFPATALENLSINQPDLADLEKQTSFNAQVINMMEKIINNGEYLPHFRVANLLHENLVKSQTKGWGHALELGLESKIDLMQKKITLISNYNVGLNFGRHRKAALLVQDFYQPIQCLVRTNPKAYLQSTFAAATNIKCFALKLGYDFFWSYQEKIDYAYNCYHNQTLKNYFTEKRILTDLAEAQTTKEHRIFLNIKKPFKKSLGNFNFGIDYALSSNNIPKNICCYMKINYKF